MAKNGVLLRLERSEGGKVDDDGSEKVVHVLAVDDSLVDRKVIERLLRITSFKVTAVESGWRALQFLGLDGDENSVELDRLKVDLIITDYCMPGVTGYDLLKRIKGSSAFRKVPVVIMSSENVVARIHRCLEEGAEDFIVKPVKLSDIKRLKNAMFGDKNATKPDDHHPQTPLLPPPPTDNTTIPSTPSPNSTESDSSSSWAPSPTSPHSPLDAVDISTPRDPHQLKNKDPIGINTPKSTKDPQLELLQLKNNKDDDDRNPTNEDCHLVK